MQQVKGNIHVSTLNMKRRERGGKDINEIYTYYATAIIFVTIPHLQFNEYLLPIFEK